MPSDTIEAPPKSKSVPHKSKHAGATFRVLRDYGPWRAIDASGRPSIFSETTFRELHPIPTKDRDDKPISPINDVDRYYEDLITYALGVAVIAHAPGETPTPVPLGPSAGGRSADPNVILESLRQFETNKTLRDGIERGMKPVAASGK